MKARCSGKKKIFKDQSEAEKVISKMKESLGKNNKKRKSLSSYFCSVCKGWHVTSMKKETYTKIQRDEKFETISEYWKSKKGWD